MGGRGRADTKVIRIVCFEEGLSNLFLLGKLQGGILKLRTYLPVFCSYVDEGDVSAAFQLYIKMKNAKGVILLSEHCIQLMACIAENGFFK